MRSFLSSRASQAVRQCVCKKQQAAVEIKRRVRSTKLYRTTTLPAVTEHICPTPSLVAVVADLVVVELRTSLSIHLFK